MADATHIDHSATDASAVAVTHDGLVNTGDSMALLSHMLPLCEGVLIYPRVSHQIAPDMRSSGVGKQLIDGQAELVCSLIEFRLRQGFFTR